MPGISESDTEQLDQVRVLHESAVAENLATRPASAKRLVEAGFRVLTGSAEVPEGLAADIDPDTAELLISLTITLAKSDAELLGVARAFEILDQAHRLSVAAGVASRRVAIANQRGVLHLRVNELTHAITEFEAAEADFAGAPVVDVGLVLLNRGVARLYAGQLREARRDLRRAVAEADGAALSTIAAMAKHNLGYVEFLGGNLVEGLELMTQAAEADAGIPLGISFLDRARLLAEAGMTRESDDALRAAIVILRKGRSGQDVAEATLTRAECSLLAGDVDAARRFAGQARDWFRRRGNDGWRRAAELALLQGDLAAGRPGRRLVAPARRLRAEFAEQGFRVPARTATLIAIEAQLAAGELPAAAAELDGLPPLRRIDPIGARLHERYVVASVRAAEGNRRAAIREVGKGLRELADYQAHFGSIDLRTASAVHGRRLAQLDLGLALDVGPEAVFVAAERARAVSSRLPPVRPPEDPVTADLLAELRQVVEQLTALDAATDARLASRRRELEQAIAARRWTLPGSGAARPIAALAEVGAQLAAQATTMVSFVAVGDQLHILLMRDGSLTVRPAGPVAPVRELIRRARADLDVVAAPLLPAGLRTAVRASLRRSLDGLDDLLGRPLHLHGPVVLVTTGVLGQVPWSLLPSLAGVPITVAPSATAWMAAGTDAASPRSGLVALAGPDLRRAEQEVLGVGGTALVGPAATRAALIGAMDRAQIVHIAAHGTHQTENPLFSSLRLADGALFAHELDTAMTTPEHVVLSACELGLATVRPGDEALGLTSVLLGLGTRCVVGGVARVSDEVAAAVMLDYHRHLAAGTDTAQALARAVAAVDEPAPFVCFGAAWRPAPILAV